MKSQKGKVATGKSSTALPAVIDTSKYLTLYRDMSTAIASCHAIDECKDIADKSAGLAAYYEQIKDTETERMFYQVKLRAWRRIGEIFSVIDLSGCETQSSKIKKIREHFDESVVAELSDARIAEVLKLKALPAKDFEFALKRITSGGIQNLLQWHTPERVAQIKANFARRDKEHRAYQKKLASPEHQKKELEQLERSSRENRHLNELVAASAAALKEVGITLERKDRARMKSVVFLIKDEVHAVMRQAAFDQKITMQEVLRRGLKMWLIAHDYEFPDDAVGAAVSHRQYPDARR